MMNARVISITRRAAELRDEIGNNFSAKIGEKIEEIVVGDVVEFSRQHDQIIIEKVLERRNCLKRSYRDVTKELVANVDMLFVMAAVAPLFNTTFIDRILIAAAVEDIPAILVVNKVDLGVDETLPLVKVYEATGTKCLRISAKFGDGIDKVLEIINQPSVNTVAIAGISGVGKSTLINRLVPGTKQVIRDVSERTGQGRQTTSQAIAISFPRSSAKEVLLVDLPGIQNFGVSHLSDEDLRNGFPEIARFGAQCPFSNCSHIKEEQCAVKNGVTDGAISPSRYESYQGIVEEISKAKEY